MVVTIKCLDTSKLVRVDEEGRLWGDMSTKQLTENPSRVDHLFEAQQKGNCFALKSLKSNKFLELDKSCHFKYTSQNESAAGASFYIEDEYLFVNQSPKGYLGMISSGELVVLPTNSPTTSPCRLLVSAKNSSLNENESDEESSEESKSSNETSPPETEPVGTQTNGGSGKQNDKKGKYGDLQNKRITALTNNSRKKKFNSTSTLFVQDTIAAPNIDQLLFCVCKWICLKVANGHERPEPYFLDIFDETKHPIGARSKGVLRPPIVEEIYSFLSSIFKAMNLNAECAIVCLVYIERLVVLTGVTLHATNWKRILLSTLILASKVWEDLAVWNADFLHLFRGLSVAHLNELEKYLLNYLQFNVTVKASLYVKYYFDVRELAPPESTDTFTPLNKEAASRLEENSHIHEEKTRVKSQSVEMSGKGAATPYYVLN